MTVAAASGSDEPGSEGAALWFAASVAPVERSGQDRPADELIGPGIIGFLVTFGVAVALVFLVRDMNRRIQRLRYGRGDTDAPGDADGPDAGRGPDPGAPGNPS